VDTNIIIPSISVIYVSKETPEPITIGGFDDHTTKENFQKMSDTCMFPCCKYPQDRGGYCLHHAKHFAGAKIKPAPKPIPKESKKRAAENRKYRKEVGKELESDPRCHINSPLCTGLAQGMNHKQKRSPKNLSLKSNLTNACNACNGYVENNPAWAAANGHQVSRFAINEEQLCLTEEQIEALPAELYVEGNIKTFEILINNITLYPTHSLKVRRHAETFMWGNPSMGSLQLALAILLDHLPTEQALHLYKRFEIAVIDKWPFTSFEITLNFREIIQQLINKKHVTN